MHSWTSTEVPYKRSPSMRREWIEMWITMTATVGYAVSLHAEGVD